jgi:hypothetical protein
MISLLSENRQGIKGTAPRSFSAPDKFHFLTAFYRPLPFKALHLFTLMTENRGIHTGAEIILPDADGRFFDIDLPEMEEGTDHLTEVAAAAFLSINLNFH